MIKYNKKTNEIMVINMEANTLSLIDVDKQKKKRVSLIVPTGLWRGPYILWRMLTRDFGKFIDSFFREWQIEYIVKDKNGKQIWKVWKGFYSKDAARKAEFRLLVSEILEGNDIVPIDWY